MKNIVVIGGLGNVGIHLLKKMEQEVDLKITCIAKASEKNKKKARIFKKIQFVWADVLEQDISLILKKADIIINLAAILPPVSEKDIKTSNKMNYLFVKDILNQMSFHAKFIFVSTSGVNFYNATTKSKLFYKNYLTQKRKAEDAILASHHLFTIIRPPFIWNTVFPTITASLFDIPLNNRMEFIHIDDVITEIAKAVEKYDNEIVNLGGNRACQIIYQDYLKFCLAGYFPTDEKLFAQDFYPTDWINGQSIKQHITFTDMVKETQKKHWLIFWFRKIFKPFIIKKWEKQSPYLLLSNKTATN